MDKQKILERKARAKQILKELTKLFPNVGMVLNYTTHWELVVAVILSAQCTDKRVNMVTKELFQKYRSLDAYADADLNTFQEDIRSTGFYKNKAKNIIAAARRIRDTYDGVVPNTMEDLLTLPGVARKTANVVLGNAFGIVEGIAVDTHVRRFARKLDLTDHTDPNKIEQDLMRLFPKKEWFALTYKLIEYGREICPARPHQCEEHPLSRVYPPAAQNWPKSK